MAFFGSGPASETCSAVGNSACSTNARELDVLIVRSKSIINQVSGCNSGLDLLSMMLGFLFANLRSWCIPRFEFESKLA